jgi:hypothetical protein
MIRTVADSGPDEESAGVSLLFSDACFGDVGSTVPAVDVDGGWESLEMLGLEHAAVRANAAATRGMHQYFMVRQYPRGWVNMREPCCTNRRGSIRDNRVGWRPWVRRGFWPRRHCHTHAIPTAVPTHIGNGLTSSSLDRQCVRVRVGRSRDLHVRDGSVPSLVSIFACAYSITASASFLRSFSNSVIGET